MRAHVIVSFLGLFVLACAAGASGPPAAKPPEPKAAAPATADAAVLPPLPATPRVPVSETLHGVTIVDDYRWLESGKDPAVQAWSAVQNARARALLDGLPGVPLLERRVRELMTRVPASVGRLVWQGTRGFAFLFDPAKKQQPGLVVLDSLSPGAEPRMLIDPMLLDPTGSTTIDWFVPSTDASKVAVSLSKGGSESGTVHVYDVQSGKETGDVILRVQGGTAGGSVAWTHDNKGFWYTRYPRPGERPEVDLDFYQQVWFHTLGTPDAHDTYVVGKEFPKIAEIELLSSRDGRQQLALVANGDGGDHSLWIRQGKTFRRLAQDEDGVIAASFGGDGGLWILSKKDAPRGRVLRMPLANPGLARASVVLGEQAGTIEEFLVTESRLYAVEMLGGPTRIRQFDLAGRELPMQAPIERVSTNARLEWLGGDDVFFITTSPLSPTTGYAYRAKTGVREPTLVKTTALVDFSDAELITEEATSKDGTKIPMYILAPKGTPRNKKNPTLLTGYGGYGISTRPGYNELAHVLLEQGFVIVRTALRGGGEFGEEWHRAGMLEKKQNVFDDFLACAERLIELGLTSPRRLAIEGGSNGGLLMGAALTQRPELFASVLAHVGIYDMVHVEDSPNGQFNTTEFGTVKNPDQFRALYAYSPYHRVRDGASYPAVLFMTGENDPRVDPMQSRKMTARLQAANPSGRPVLLRTSANTGHGMGSPLEARIGELVDAYAFLLHSLGVSARAVGVSVSPVGVSARPVPVSQSSATK